MANDAPRLPSKKVLFVKPNRRRERPKPTPSLPESYEATVGRLSHLGDGMVETPAGRRFVPFTAPGDKVRLKPGRAAPRKESEIPVVLEALLAPSPHRAAPACRHFGTCGGCAVQHVDDDTYGAWKRDLVVQALRHRGFREVAVDPLVRVPAQSRRRATLSFRRKGRTATLGFRRRSSHDIVDVEQCPVLWPGLERLLPALRALIAGSFPEGLGGQIEITACDTGIDLVVYELPPPDRALRESAARFAAQNGVARVSWMAQHGFVDLIASHSQPVVRFGGIAVPVPPGAFLQAVAQSETEIATRVERALQKAERVADLFCGLGTIALPLARARSVHGIDGDLAMVAALKQAVAMARTDPPLRLSVEHRDLSRRPLQADELARFQAVVFDPPRAGAQAQAEPLARSRVPLVLAVSCNPATFARDARTLVDGGYRLERVTPVDQFVWSPHVELVAVLRKK
jgi:23S rRNA (uracil1939-C5)-methyltransferase